MVSQAEIDRAFLLGRIAERARKLIADGYEIEQDERMPELWYVFKPGRPVNRQFWPHYVVWTDENICDCPAYAKFGTCKHYLAVQAIINENAWADGQAALIANAEDSRFGCDQFAEH